MPDSFNFAILPADLRRHLLLGFSGRLHLHATAGVALSHVSQPGDPFSTIARDALMAAWSENPFDGNCVAALVSNMDRFAPIPSRLLSTIKAIMAHWQPVVTAEAQQAMAGTPDEQLAFLRDRLRHAPESLFWWHHLYEYVRIQGDWQVLAEALVRATPLKGLTYLFSYALANSLLAAGNSLPAIGTYRECSSMLPLPSIEEHMATAWIRAGKMDMGRDILQQISEARPWNVGLLLRLHALTTGDDIQLAAPPGQTMVLGYSWNKADDLAETLESLFSSDLGDALVRILDNGSSDHTPEVIRQFTDKYGMDKVGMVTMPVNIGAPAARNWLMSLPEVQASEYMAYIDDDISLPRDWLLRLGAAVERYPDAGVWGCKVVDYDGLARVQCGEHNLAPSVEERQQALMSSIMLQDGDFGQADYIRPCASVTGCVHLFKTDRLLASGCFDLRFSPTQYDDLERDLRMVLGGGYAVYTGFLGVRHKRKSGSMSEVGRPESAGETANKHKLMTKYSSEEFEKMAVAMDRILLDDIMGKMAQPGA